MAQDEPYRRNAKAWRVNAEFALYSSKILFETRNPTTWFSAAILGHHALEMLLKSALVCEGFTVAKGEPQHGFAWGHRLVELARLLVSRRREFPFDKSATVLARFDAFFDELRYPSDLEKVEELSEEDKHDLVEIADCIRPFAAPFTNTSFD